MLKNLYVAAWFLWAAAVLVSLSGGAFETLTLLALSFGALILVYALALWSVISNTREIK
ncbi:MAG TPA: hypothetical protein VIL74_11845 [Pyrinomonadaceae bacterium]